MGRFVLIRKWQSAILIKGLRKLKSARCLPLSGNQIPYYKLALQVARRIHAVVKDSNNRNPVVGHSEIDHVSLNIPSTIAWTDVRSA